MKRLRVVVSPSVDYQILDQVIHIAKHSIDNALAWEQRLRKAIRAIGEAPFTAIDEDATKRLGQEIRRFSFEGTYLIHYRVDEVAEIVEVVNFRHGARLPRRGEP
jgi:plasmid stabilization system protein ParE